jgi:cytochrome P450
MHPTACYDDRKTDLVNHAATHLPAQPRKMPGPRGVRLVRALLRMRTDVLGTFAEQVREHGDAVRFALGPRGLVLLNHPDHVAHVLQRNAPAYKRSANYRELGLVLGQGLLNSEGRLWQRQRRLIQPLFHRHQVAQIAPLVTRLTQEMLEAWRGLPSGQSFDVHVEMMRLTLRVVGHALFSTDLAAECDELGQALKTVLPVVQKRTERLVNLPLWAPLPAHVRFRKAMRALDRIVLGLIHTRQKAGAEAPRDLLAVLLQARDPQTGEGMGPRQVRDEVMTFLLAGHETTANALSWTLYLLARNPEAESRLRAEIREALGDRPPALEDLPRLEYTRRVLQESMRLCPPAWLLEREALEEDVVGGFRVPRGALVMLCPYTVHRHTEFWDEPERFDPDRFLPERSAQRPRCAYFPFGSGQRQCIGEAFAMLEMELILPQVLQAVRLEAVPGHPVEPDPGVTLRPRHGILMKALPCRERLRPEEMRNGM